MKKFLLKLAESLCLLILVCSCSPKTMNKNDVEAFQLNTLSDDMTFYYKGSKDQYDYFQAQWTSLFEGGDFCFRVKHGELSVGEPIKYSENQGLWRKLDGSMYDDPNIIKRPDPSIVDAGMIKIHPDNAVNRYFTEIRSDPDKSYYRCNIRVENKSKFNICEINILDFDMIKGRYFNSTAKTRFSPPLKPDEARDISYEMSFWERNMPSYDGPCWDSFVTDNGDIFHCE